MLSLHTQAGFLRRANNLVPRRAGGMASRPGARQIVTGRIDNGAPWGNRLLLEKAGSIVVWDGVGETVLAPAGHCLQVAPYQALTVNAQRENRAYVADGLRPLWFVVYRSGQYVVETVRNKVTAADGATYEIPIPHTIATFCNRLVIGSTTNRAQHCQNEDPDYWDPLWTIEFQGARPGRVRALCAHGETLLAGLDQDIWGVTGTSHLNWQRAPLLEGVGAGGARCLAGDGQTAFCVSPAGVFRLGQAEPISADLDEAFLGKPYGSEVALDTRRRWALVRVHGRVFVTHLDAPGRWGEITGHAVTGLLQLDDYVGWYGTDGAWVLSARDTADVWLDGTRREVTSVYDGWDDIPNRTGSGRALLPRAHVSLAGSARGDVHYTVSSDEGEFTATASLCDDVPPRWTDELAGLNGEGWPTPPVLREFAPALPGRKFRHQFEANCHLEVLEFKPQYRFGKEE